MPLLLQTLFLFQFCLQQTNLVPGFLTLLSAFPETGWLSEVAHRLFSVLDAIPVAAVDDVPSADQLSPAFVRRVQL